MTQQLIDHVQVNVPFTMLFDIYLPLFIQHRLNPEIGLDAHALDRFTRTHFTAIAHQLNDHGLSVTLHGPFIDLSPGSPDPSISDVTRQRFEQVLRLVPLFKPKTVVLHAGYERKRYSFIRKTWIENSLAMWSWLAAEIRDEGSFLMLENVYEDGPEDIKVLFENLGEERVGFCLDVGHQAVFSVTPLEEWLESLGPYLGQIHLHDNDGKKDDHLALGSGTINLEPLFDYLKAPKTNAPVVTLEPHRKEDLWPSLVRLEKLWRW